MNGGSHFMKQIILNYLTIFILPFLLGAFVRFLLRKFSRAWLATAVCAVLTATMFALFLTVDSFGNEAFGIWLYVASCLLLGSLLTGTIARLLNRRKLYSSFEPEN